MRPSSVEALEQLLASLGHWLLFWTMLVVVGLIVEYIPEIIHLVRTRPFPWKKVNVILGGILITAGVAGELYIEGRASRAETQLRALLGPRTLTLEQQHAVGDSCRRFSGIKVRVASNVLDIEGQRLALQIEAALKLAGMQVTDDAATLEPSRGIPRGVQVNGSSRERGEAIATALRSEGNLSSSYLVKDSCFAKKNQSKSSSGSSRSIWPNREIQGLGTLLAGRV